MPLPFSCKDRTFCPSCTARRAAETAANLVDHVLPRVPLRQWVPALPPDLHVRVARDPELETKVLAIFCEELEELLRGTAKAPQAARGGTVTFLHYAEHTIVRSRARPARESAVWGRRSVADHSA